MVESILLAGIYNFAFYEHDMGILTRSNPCMRQCGPEAIQGFMKHSSERIYLDAYLRKDNILIHLLHLNGSLGQHWR